MEGQKVGTLQDEMRTLANMWRAEASKLNRQFVAESAMAAVLEGAADELEALADGWGQQGS